MRLGFLYFRFVKTGLYILSYGLMFQVWDFKFFFWVIGVIGFVLCFFLWVGLINKTCVAILASS